MGYRRGLLLGFLAGVIGVAVSRRSEGPDSERSSLGGARVRSIVREAGSEARRERDATVRQLRSRYERARRAGHLPSSER